MIRRQFQTMIHPAATGNRWTRTYIYDEASLIEPGKKSNRLTRRPSADRQTKPSPEPYGYDAHGNMLRMPHLPVMQWDFKDQLH